MSTPITKKERIQAELVQFASGPPHSPEYRKGRWPSWFEDRARKAHETHDKAKQRFRIGNGKASTLARAEAEVADIASRVERCWIGAQGYKPKATRTFAAHLVANEHLAKPLLSDKAKRAVWIRKTRCGVPCATFAVRDDTRLIGGSAHGEEKFDRYVPSTEPTSEIGTQWGTVEKGSIYARPTGNELRGYRTPQDKLRNHKSAALSEAELSFYGQHPELHERADHAAWNADPPKVMPSAPKVLSELAIQARDNRLAEPRKARKGKRTLTRRAVRSKATFIDGFWRRISREEQAQITLEYAHQWQETNTVAPREGTIFDAMAFRDTKEDSAPPGLQQALDTRRQYIGPNDPRSTVSLDPFRSANWKEFPFVGLEDAPGEMRKAQCQSGDKYCSFSPAVPVDQAPVQYSEALNEIDSRVTGFIQWFNRSR